MYYPTMITVSTRVDGDMLIITIGDETTEIPLWLIRGWSYEDENNGDHRRNHPDKSKEAGK